MDELDRIQSTEGPLREQIDRMNAEVDQLIGQESVLRQKEAVVQNDLDQKQAELDKATAELNAQKAELARVRAKLQEAVGALEQLLVEIYKSNDPDLTAVVMQSTNWSDLLTRTEYIEHIRNYDDQVVEQVRGLRDQITALVGAADRHPRPDPDRARPGRGQEAGAGRGARADRGATGRAGRRPQRPGGRAPGDAPQGAPDRWRPLQHPGAGWARRPRARRRCDPAGQRPARGSRR